MKKKVNIFIINYASDKELDAFLMGSHLKPCVKFETIGNLPSPLKVNENSLKENIVWSPPECDVLNGNGRM